MKLTRSLVPLPLALALALLSAGTRGAAAFGPGQALEKGMIYQQPSYHYSNNLQLDLAVLRA